MVADLAIGAVKTAQASLASTQRELERLLRLVEEGARREAEAKRHLDTALRELSMARMSMPLLPRVYAQPAPVETVAVRRAMETAAQGFQRAEDAIHAARNLV